MVALQDDILTRDLQFLEDRREPFLERASKNLRQWLQGECDIQGVDQVLLHFEIQNLEQVQDADETLWIPESLVREVCPNLWELAILD